jgi:hypothetical protein
LWHNHEHIWKKNCCVKNYVSIQSQRFTLEIQHGKHSHKASSRQEASSQAIQRNMEAFAFAVKPEARSDSPSASNLGLQDLHN